ncbi:MAG: DUF975 family protein [Coprobacillaceae bacterium]
MRISDIKYKAAEILEIDKTLIIKVCICIGVISSICTYISNIIPGFLGSIVSLAITIGTMTLAHGYVTTSLKAVNNRYDEIDIQKDSLTGIYRFKELFGTYFIHSFFLFIILMVLGLIGFVIAKGMVSNSTINEFRYLLNLDINQITDSILSTNAVQEILDVAGFIMLYCLFIAVIVLIYMANFSLTFFIVEKYQIKGAEAMKESMRLMKGYKRTYCLLCLSYLGWIILAAIIEYMLFSFLPISLITGIVGVIISNILYNAKFNISLAVLYEEIDLAKDMNTNTMENGV